jgi:hypothetical protein
VDVQAVKPDASAAATPVSGGSPAESRPAPGKELPRAAGLDPVVLQQSREVLDALARQISSFLHSNSRELQFMVDAESGDAVITVRDADGNVVRRIPGEEALAMLRRSSVDTGTFVDLSV